jgi:hypothetical protein
LTSGYLSRLDGRRALAALRRQIVFGLALGALLALVGAHRTYLVLAAKDAVWKPVMWAGFAALALTLILPSVWTWPEKVLHTAAGTVSKWVLQLLLCLVYVLVMLPFGVAMRLRRGPHPLYSWKEHAPSGAEGWVEKQVFAAGTSRDGAGRTRFAALAGLVDVLAFFVRRGDALLIPALILLLLLALFFFFVQTSALAPFIYTLF